MGMISWDDAIKKLKSDQTYIDAFMRAYGKDMSKELIVDAIAEYEKTLITLNSPFDKYLRDEATAISENQIKGYELFKEPLIKSK